MVGLNQVQEKVTVVARGAELGDRKRWLPQNCMEGNVIQSIVIIRWVPRKSHPKLEEIQVFNVGMPNCPSLTPSYVLLGLVFQQHSMISCIVKCCRTLPGHCHKVWVETPAEQPGGISGQIGGSYSFIHSFIGFLPCLSVPWALKVAYNIKIKTKQNTTV